MELKSLGSVLKATVIAGLAAGILVSIFHFAVTEPVMDQAIEIEEQLHQVQGVTGETLLVNRDAQKAGLFLGFIMYGITWSLLFGVAYHLAQGWLTAKRWLGRDALLVLLAGWSVALLPFLKYAANPPGVGDPATVEYRQAIFLTFVALSVANTVLALLAYRYVRRVRKGHLRWGIALATYGAGALALYIAMPTNPDAVHMPADLVWTFRVLSFTGLVIFWAGFSGVFAWLVRPSRPAPRRRPAGLPRLRMN